MPKLEKIKLAVSVIVDIGVSSITNYILKPMMDEMSGVPKTCAKIGMGILEFMIGDFASSYVCNKIEPLIKEEE